LATPLAIAGLLLTASAASAAPTGSIRQYPTPSANSEPVAIAPGPEGSMWFTEQREGKIGRITLAGAPINEWTIPTPESEPTAIALGPDGNLWFTEEKGDKIGRITPGGVISEFPLPPNRRPNAITAGPGGLIWFTENGEEENEKKEHVRVGRIGRISTAGGPISETIIPTSTGEPMGITSGPDGNIWFTERSAGNIGRMPPAGEIQEFHVNGGGGPNGITVGPNGELWFTLEYGDKIGRITTSGTPITQTQLPTPNSRPNQIALGPDGALWFTENGPHKVIIEGKEEERESSRIGRITLAEEIGEYVTEIPESGPAGIATGADGNLWFAESRRNNIGRIGSGVLEPLLGALAVSGNHEAESVQSCTATWASWSSLQPSTALFGFDGYRWFVNGALVASGQLPTYKPTMANVGYPLSCAVTASYPLFDTTTATASAPVTVIPPPPTLAAVTQSAANWREGNKLATISATGKRGRGKHGGKHGAGKHHKRKPPVGTTFAFALNEQAGVSLTFTHNVAGRSVAHKCVAQTRHNRKRKHCSLTVTAGVLSFTGHEGINHVRFEGHVSAHTKLTPGPYTVTVSAVNSTGPSAPSSLHFTIAK
jgi:virginiamycin B lyase